MTDHNKQIAALISAGEKATQGEWEFYHRAERSLGSAISDEVCKVDFPYAVQVPEPPFAFGKIGFLSSHDPQSKENTQFITQAANSREALKALVAERDRLREVVVFAAKHSSGQLQESAKQALKESDHGK